MDLSQTKLIKDEWEAMEKRVHENEMEILKLIKEVASVSLRAKLSLVYESIKQIK